jgi:hypothetical protein
MLNEHDALVANVVPLARSSVSTFAAAADFAVRKDLREHSSSH